MTPYRFDNQVKKQTISRKKIAIFVVGILGIVVVSIFVLGNIFQSLFRGPAWLTQTLQQSTAESISLLTPKSIVLKKNRDLENRLRSYDVQTLELVLLKNENEALRKQLGYKNELPETITAQIIAKPGRSLYDSMILDRGLQDGINIGQKVLAEKNILLGEIVATTDRTATVRLYSGSHFDGDLIIKNEKNTTVPAQGKGSGNFEIHIPREITVVDGDLLALPNHPNWIVGVVKSIQFDPRDPFQTILARIPVNVQELRFVEVVKY